MIRKTTHQNIPPILEITKSSVKKLNAEQRFQKTKRIKSFAKFVAINDMGMLIFKNKVKISFTAMN